MIIAFATDGTASTIYTEQFPLAILGSLQVTRASNVEFNADIQQWQVRFTEQPDRVAFTHPSRAECIRWEVEQLNKNL